MKIKKDKYLRARGGTAKICDVVCTKCNEVVFVYQKDGSGWLKRCYINRILIPKNIVLKKRYNCKCGQAIGYLTHYKDGRRAYTLTRGNFRRRPSKYDKQVR